MEKICTIIGLSLIVFMFVLKTIKIYINVEKNNAKEAFNQLSHIFLLGATACMFIMAYMLLGDL